MWTKRKAIHEAQLAIDEYNHQANEFVLERDAIAEESDQYALEYNKVRMEIVSELVGVNPTEQSISFLAEQWGANQLTNLYSSLEDQKKNKLTERDKLKSNDTVQRRYELLESDSAVLYRESNDAESILQKEVEGLKKYETKEFRWLYDRKCHELKNDSSFGKFWNVITLNSRKEKNYRAMVAEVFGQSPLRSIVGQYEANLDRKNRASESLEAAQIRKNEAEKLIKHFDELNAWEFNFEGMIREETHSAFSKYFESLSPDSIIARSTGEIKTKAIRMHALAKKYEYAVNLENYLQKEKADRLERVNSINRVRNKWRRNPSGYVRGDKSKWLQDIPKMKNEGTKKRLTWSRKMRGSIFGFNDYAGYGGYYHSHCRGTHGFLAYDVFNSHMRMPHEGFSGEVIPDVQEFREEFTTKEWLDEAEVEPQELGIAEDVLDMNEDTDMNEDFATSSAIVTGEIVGLEEDFQEDVEIMESLIDEDMNDNPEDIQDDS